MTSAPAFTDLASKTNAHCVHAVVTVPVPGRRGGVGQYFCTLLPHVHRNVRYVSVGSRSDRENIAVSLRRMFTDSWRFARTLSREQCDIVHLNPSLGLKAVVRDAILLAIAKWFRKTSVVFFHGIDGQLKGFSAFLLGRFFQLAYSRADAFIVLSTEIKDKLIGWGCKRPIFLCRAPVSDEFFSCREHHDRAQGGSHSFNILFLARIERSKGIYEAIETYQLLRKNFPFVTLTVAGEGSELSAVRNYAAAAGISGIMFTGFIEGDRKLAVLRAADAYLFPSHYEGLPLSVLEAMACGVPVIASRVGALCDFFRDGYMGFLADDRAPAALAHLVTELIRNPNLCSTIRQFNRAYATDHFAADRLAEDIDRLYRHVLGWSDQAVLPVAKPSYL
jgi:glycosyltransferase involved in cell wall biosynthesis